MRTTVDIDDVVLAAARSKARLEGISLGRAVSDLALQALRSSAVEGDRGGGGGLDLFFINGPSDHVVTDELVAQVLQDE